MKVQAMKEEFYNALFLKERMSEADNNKLINFTKGLNLKTLGSMQSGNINEYDFNKPINMNIILEIDLPITVFAVNSRKHLVEHVKKTFATRAYYYYYISTFDYNDIMNKELPYGDLVGEHYRIKLPIMAELYVFFKEQVVQMKLILETNFGNNQIELFAVTEQLSCALLQQKDYITELSLPNKELIIHKTTKDEEHTQNVVYHNGDMINVKITEFKSNYTESGFSTKVNCAGYILLP